MDRRDFPEEASQLINLTTDTKHLFNYGDLHEVYPLDAETLRNDAIWTNS